MRPRRASPGQTSAGEDTDVARADLRLVATHSSWAFAQTAVEAGLRLAEMLLLARYLGPSAFGVYVLILAVPDAVQQLLDFRAREAMTRFMGEFVATGDGRRAAAMMKLLWLLDVAVGVLALAVAVAAAGLAARFVIHDPGVASLIAVSAVGRLFGALDGPAGAFLRVMGRFALTFGLVAMVGSVRLGLMVAVVLGGWGLPGAVWVVAASELLVTLVLGTVAWRFFLRTVGLRRGDGLRPLSDRAPEIRSFLVHTNLTGAIKALATKADALLVGALATAASAGTYRLAVQLGSGLLLLGDALFVAVFPALTKLHAIRATDRLRALVRRLSLLLAGTSLPAAVGLSVTAGWVIRLLLGHPYAAATAPFVVLVWGVVPAVIFSWVRALLLSMGEAGFLLRIGAGTAGVQIGLLLLLVPRFGALGGTVALAVAHVLFVGLELRRLRTVGIDVGVPAAAAARIAVGRSA